MRTKDLSDDLSTYVIQSIILGTWYDLEKDAISYSLKCLNCEVDAGLFTFDYAKMEIIVSSSTPFGSYRLELILTDDNVDS